MVLLLLLLLVGGEGPETSAMDADSAGLACTASPSLARKLSIGRRVGPAAQTRLAYR